MRDCTSRREAITFLLIMKKTDTKKALNAITYTLVLSSVIFLVLYLQRNGLLFIPTTIKWGGVAGSLALLLMGYVFFCMGWQTILKSNEINITYREAVSSLGISILGKYIPGKLWLIAGMSSKVAAVTGEPMVKIGLISTILQIFSIGIAAIVGVGSIYTGIPILIISLFYAGMLLLIFCIITKKDLIVGSKVFVNNSFARKWGQPVIESFSTRLLVQLVLTWTCWSVGFYLLCISLFPSYKNPIIGFTFALAASLGILVVFAPGGLGVREGLLGLLLTAFISSKKDIATLAAFSRLWFLLGEILMFLTAVIITISLWWRKRRSSC